MDSNCSSDSAAPARNSLFVGAGAPSGSFFVLFGATEKAVPTLERSAKLRRAAGKLEAAKKLG